MKTVLALTFLFGTSAFANPALSFCSSVSRDQGIRNLCVDSARIPGTERGKKERHQLLWGEMEHQTIVAGEIVTDIDQIVADGQKLQTELVELKNKVTELRGQSRASDREQSRYRSRYRDRDAQSEEETRTRRDGLDTDSIIARSFGEKIDIYSGDDEEEKEEKSREKLTGVTSVADITSIEQASAFLNAILIPDLESMFDDLSLALRDFGQTYNNASSIHMISSSPMVGLLPADVPKYDTRVKHIESIYNSNSRVDKVDKLYSDTASEMRSVERAINRTIDYSFTRSRSAR